MNPLIFCVNVSPNIFSYYRLTQFRTLLSALQRGSKRPIEIIPNLDGGPITKRAKYFEVQVNRVMERLNATKCHLLGYSLSGIDLRYALGDLKSVRSLTTIASPHLYINQIKNYERGSFLIDQYIAGEIGNVYIDPITKLTGVPRKYMEEVNT